ncbi:hypothetical protein AMTRI_Chr08g202050 [Amborella trichopoda]
MVRFVSQLIFCMLTFWTSLVQGQIPKTFVNLTSIVAINLSDSHLSGEFLENLKYLMSLRCLDLSYNELEGEVPDDEILVKVVAHEEHSHKAMKTAILNISLLIVKILLCATLVVLQRKRLRRGLHSTLCRNRWFNKDNLIGFGTFGSVYKGTLSDGVILAVKVSFAAEYRALSSIRHMNLVKLITCCSSRSLQGNEFKALVFEFMPAPPTNSFSYGWMSMAIIVAYAIDYKHHECPTTIVHCNLKRTRILSPMTTLENQSSAFGLKGSIGCIPPGNNHIAFDINFGILLLDMFIGLRATNNMLPNGLNLDEFTSKAYPDRMMEVADKRHFEEGGANRVWAWQNGVQTRLLAIMGIRLFCSMKSLRY